MKRSFLLTAAFLFLGTGSARAEMITWQALMTITAADGETNFGSPSVAEMFPVGSSLTWTMSFDTARAPSDAAVVGPLFGGPGVYHYPVGEFSRGRQRQRTGRSLGGVTQSSGFSPTA